MGFAKPNKNKRHQRAHAVRVRWAPSLTRRVLRHPILWWSLALLLAVGGGANLLRSAQQLEQQRNEWGETRQVAVIVRPVQVGEPVIDAIELRELPRAFVAASAVEHASASAFARVPLYPGEVLLAERVTASEATGLPADAAALTVSLARQSPLVEVGDLVDLWAVDTAARQSHRVATRVVVLARSADELTIAVPQSNVGAVALAAVQPLTAALVG